MPSEFHNLNLRFASPAALKAWLSGVPRPAWQPVGSTYHNTLKPTEATWQGHATMEAMARHYTGLGWDRGPHIFIAVGTSADGIFVMTPPWLEGIHAGPCNSVRFGLEMVGNFHARPMSTAQVDMLANTAAVLHLWAGIGSDIDAHRDCMPGRTCPGDAAYLQKPRIEAELRARLGQRYSPASPILAPAGASLPTVILRFATPAVGYTRSDVRTILSAYWRTCLPVGVDPVVAVAQMAHETGSLSSWWAQRPRRNPAGIGVTGEIRPGTDPQPQPEEVWHRDAAVWRRGNAFRSWEGYAIPAHVGRLLAYALPVGSETPEQQALIETALAVRPLPVAYRGSAPTLQGLEGRWAVPGHNYAEAIAARCNKLAG
jgi:hypothetical protein